MARSKAATKAIRWLAANIREQRRARGMTQAELAEAVGVDSRTVRNLETGDVAGRVDTVADVAEALGVSVARLFEEARELERNPRGRPRQGS